MKRRMFLFVTLSILLLIVLLSNKFLNERKNKNMQSMPVVIQKMFKSEESYKNGFEKAGPYRIREYTFNSPLMSFVVQKPMNNSLSSMTVNPDANRSEMHESRFPAPQIVTRMSDVLILVSIVLMIIIFTIKFF